MTIDEVFKKKFAQFKRHAMRLSGFDSFSSDDIVQDAIYATLHYITHLGGEFESEAHLINFIHHRIRYAARPKGRGRDNIYGTVTYVDEYTQSPTEAPVVGGIKLSEVLSTINVRSSSHKGASIDPHKTKELREIFTMEVKGYSREEIARRFNTHPQDVTNRINKFRRKCK